MQGRLPTCWSGRIPLAWLPLRLATLMCIATRRWDAPLGLKLRAATTTIVGNEINVDVVLTGAQSVAIVDLTPYPTTVTITGLNDELVPVPAQIIIVGLVVLAVWSVCRRRKAL